MKFDGRWAILGPVLGAVLAAVAGCDKTPEAPNAAGAMAPPAAQASFGRTASTAKPWFMPAPAQGPGLHLAYSHAIGLEVGGGALAAHFAAARDRCLNMPELHCILLSAEIDNIPASYMPVPVRGPVRGRQPPRPTEQSASLSVRLPHNQVAAFAASLTEKLPGESQAWVQVVRQATTAEDLGRPIADVGQRMAQLQTYLDSLKTLAGRLTISVSDLVKIAGETAQTQTQIEAARAEQRDLAQRVDTEALAVDFREPAFVAAPVDPVRDAAAGAREILRQNAGDALRFAIGVVPWIPVGLVGLLILWVFRRAVFGRR